jgi:hypothetical protein
MRLGAEDRGWSSTGWVLSGWTIEGLGGAVYGLYHAQGDDFSRFGLKTDGYGFCGLASKPLARVSRFGPQNHSLGFPGLGLKTGSCGLVI